MRLLPHDQDTGGFFVAVLRKKGTAAPPNKEDKPTASTSVSETEASVVPKLEPLDEADVKPTVADETGVSTLPLTNGKHARSPSPPESSELPEAKKVKEEEGTETKEAEVKKPKRDLGFREDPYSYTSPEHEEVKAIESVKGSAETAG